MGQYYVAVNKQKKQVLRPGPFGDSSKMVEWGSSSIGFLTALGVLMSDGCGSGNGDLITDNSEYEALIGSWAGDTVVVSGDYGKDGWLVTKKQIASWKTSRRRAYQAYDRYTPERAEEELERYVNNRIPNLYHVGGELFEDVSYPMVRTLCEDSHWKESLQQTEVWGGIPEGCSKRSSAGVAFWLVGKKVKDNIMDRNEHYTNVALAKTSYNDLLMSLMALGGRIGDGINPAMAALKELRESVNYITDLELRPPERV